MKILLFFIMTLAFGINSLCQTPRQLTKADSVQIESEVDMKAQKFKDSLKENIQYKENLHIEFSVDTFKIEKRKKLKLDIDYSTTGMIISTLDANREYDKLLNKYYQLLLTSLNEEDKEVLKKSQRNWIEFRDSELELNTALMSKYYSGGGTIQGVIAAYRVFEITKNRVIELFHYLNRKIEY